jgi:hypothetical protein
VVDAVEIGIVAVVELPEVLPLAQVEQHDQDLVRLGLPPAGGSCPFCEATENITEEDIWQGGYLN